jgi:UDP-N-acetylmuramoyl-L-alanyl-D-glutamate--2,6-diaminopimelate ligase
VITAEDPRTEKVEDICAQIAEGFKQKGKKEGKNFYIVADREKAIEFAVNLAQKEDIVAIFGKSHEKSMCFGKKEYPWDEFKAVKLALKRRLNASKR